MPIHASRGQRVVLLPDVWYAVAECGREAQSLRLCGTVAAQSRHGSALFRSVAVQLLSSCGGLTSVIW
ncbi:hypothetical protein LN040_09160 [Desulfovibrio subterraneus]|uniref:hypothetical protein n=1 Tax=Desulfovibrio subterraneus TaxID=2718620 RepID=UPI0022B916C3|nr:hypothetical protein [Desulfovibrio subterraneus]WBF69236.1 hypothetical protein LN040_09160 [Desulfovibrio subterraneus]